MPLSGTTTNYNLKKYVSGSDGWALGMNSNMDTIDTEIKSASDKGLTTAQKADFTELTDGSTTTLHEHTGILTAKQMLTLANGGFWGELRWESTTSVVIVPKPSVMGDFIGGIMQDGSFHQSTSAIQIDITDSTHHLDSFGRYTDVWYVVWLYVDGSDNLAGGLTLMPKTTIDGANPDGNTTAITLNQVNSKDIGFLFNASGDIAVWQDATDFETPIFSYGGSYDADGELYVESNTSTTVTLNKDLIITDFADASDIYQLNGFKPVKIADGTAAVSQYCDIGWRIRTDDTGSGEIIPFSIFDDALYYVNGSGSADFDTGFETTVVTTSGVISRIEYSPVDSVPLFVVRLSDENVKSKSYWATYYERIAAGKSTTYVPIRNEAKVIHGIISAKGGGGTPDLYTCGYKRRK